MQDGGDGSREDVVAEDGIRRWAVLETVELCDDYAEHGEGCGRAEVSEEGAFVGYDMSFISMLILSFAVIESKSRGCRRPCQW